MLLSRKKENPQTLLLQRVGRYWEETAYITDEETAKRMRAFLTQAQEAAEKGELQTAQSAFFQAKREHILARKNRQIFYWRSWPGMLIALFLLLVFGVGAALIITFPEAVKSSKLLLLAGLGGGVGGCVAVLLQVIDVDPNSEVVSKAPWYVLKPSLGVALGVITYMGVSLGIDVLSSQGKIDSMEGAIVIGFLAGFFESFSKGILARIAGQYLKEEDEQPKGNT